MVDMARKKSIIRIPFLKMKINARTAFVFVGLIVLLSGLLLLLSLLPIGAVADGKALSFVRIYLTDRFGMVSFFIPVLLLLLSVHIMTHSKKPFLRPNLTVGLFFIFLSIGGLAQAGSWGGTLFSLLKENISLVGTILFFFAIFYIGIVLFFDTTFDFLFGFIKSGVVAFFGLIRKTIDPSLHKAKPDDRDEYIRDRKAAQSEEKQKEATMKLPFTEQVEPHKHSSTEGEASRQTNANSDLFIKPLTQTGSTWIFPPLNLLTNVKQAEADR